MKFILLFISFTYIVMANNIKPNNIPNDLVYGILMNECYIDKGFCNPYIISFNNKKDIKKAKKLGLKFKNKRSIYCETEKKCEKTLIFLLKHKISNLDLGVFQINYKYHKMAKNEYFNFKKSKLKVKKILANLINKYGYSWETIGRYHSSTKKLNKKYCLSLYKNIKKIKKIKEQ